MNRKLSSKSEDKESWHRLGNKKKMLSDDSNASNDNEMPSLNAADPGTEGKRCDGQRDPAKKRSRSSASDCKEPLRQNKKLKHSTVTSQKEHVDCKELIVRELRDIGVRVLEKREVDAMTAAGEEFIGFGGFGDCMKAVDPLTQQQLVFKSFHNNDLDKLLIEAKNLQHFQMVNVQRLVGVCVETCQLISHFAGDTVVEYFTNYVPLADQVSIFLQVARAAQRIVETGFTHNGYKRDNVCVCDGTSGPVATIIDFGVASPVGTKLSISPQVHLDHYPWQPPEVLTSTHPTSEASEVYMIGYMMYQMLTPDEGWSHHPLVTALRGWMKATQQPDPVHRPKLAALVRIVEALHEEISRAPPPDALGIGEELAGNPEW